MFPIIAAVYSVFLISAVALVIAEHRRWRSGRFTVSEWLVWHRSSGWRSGQRPLASPMDRCSVSRKMHPKAILSEALSTRLKSAPFGSGSTLMRANCSIVEGAGLIRLFVSYMGGGRRCGRIGR
jgi:hypothetical protein